LLAHHQREEYQFMLWILILKYGTQLVQVRQMIYLKEPDTNTICIVKMHLTDILLALAAG